jgi:hypothetical protein
VQTVRRKAHEINVPLSWLGAKEDGSNSSRHGVKQTHKKRKNKNNEGRYDEKYTWLKSMWGGFLMIF